MAGQAGRQGAGRNGSDPGGEPIAAGGKSVKATPGWLLGPDFGRAIPFQTAPTCGNSRALGFQSQGWSRVFAHTIARTSSWWRTRPHNGICWSIIWPGRISG